MHPRRIRSFSGRRDSVELAAAAAAAAAVGYTVTYGRRPSNLMPNIALDVRQAAACLKEVPCDPYFSSRK